jgi:hypothetical protein
MFKWETVENAYGDADGIRMISLTRGFGSDGKREENATERGRDFPHCGADATARVRGKHQPRKAAREKFKKYALPTLSTLSTQP